MEAYNIDLSGRILTIQPLHDGSFKVIENGHEVARLFPETNELGTVWTSSGIIDHDEAQKLGALIEQN
ncbi:hypothetical protein [Pedobacter gandavensis]|uniref:Uncharacterized protein n=1 Tax=Pedobacter gandavensis TaxID=2679963 RepID=A0ABR6EQX3_9SPHI|nr:hypothetical protein [Pedobacter gandavensis]MBB2147645.1 hypothetical protein [Pedobacter gandavensis]